MKSGTTLRGRLGTALVFCLAISAVAAPSAIAASTPSPATGGNGMSGLSFTKQAEASGLSAGQANALQSEVDRYLGMLGGSQVSPNRIDLDGRGAALIALPGENHPRNFTGSTARLDPPAETCPYGAFCAFSQSGRRGSQITMTFCSSYALPGWGEHGSWVNNQTPGTSAQMIDNSGHTIDESGPAPNISNDYDWTPVWWVDPC